MLRGGTRAEKCRAQVDIDDGVPVRGAKLVERTLYVYRRHVDQNIQSAELRDSGIDEGVARLGLRQITLEDRRSPAGCAHTLGRLFRLGA